MVVYGDILFIVNMFIDYLMLGLTSAFLNCDSRLYRRILAAAVGGLSSFYIFIDSKILLIDILYRIVTSFLIILIAFSFKTLKRYMLAVVIYFIVGMFLSGAAGLATDIFKKDIAVVNNTILYLNISPLFLIATSVIFYLILKLILKIRKSHIAGKYCTVTVSFRDKTVEASGLIDTGNSLTDYLSSSEVLITEDGLFKKLSGRTVKEFFDSDDDKNRCRILPANTVNGGGLLYGVRCDKADINYEEKHLELPKPIVVVSNEMCDERFGFIVSGRIFEGR